jgi:hypothetical protein
MMHGYGIGQRIAQMSEEWRVFGRGSLSMLLDRAAGVNHRRMSAAVYIWSLVFCYNHENGRTE